MVGDREINPQSLRPVALMAEQYGTLSRRGGHDAPADLPGKSLGYLGLRRGRVPDVAVARNVHGDNDVEVVGEPDVLDLGRHPDHGAQELDRELAAEYDDADELDHLAHAISPRVTVMAEELQDQCGGAGEQHEVPLGAWAVHLEVSGRIGRGRGRDGGNELLAVERAARTDEADEEWQEPQQGPGRAEDAEHAERDREPRQLRGQDRKEDPRGRCLSVLPDEREPRGLVGRRRSGERQVADGHPGAQDLRARRRALLHLARRPPDSGPRA